MRENMSVLPDNTLTWIAYAPDGATQANVGIPQGAYIKQISWIVDSQGSINPYYWTGNIYCGSTEVWVPIIAGREATFQTLELNKWCPEDLQFENWGAFGFGGTPNVTLYVTYAIYPTSTQRNVEGALQDIHFDALMIIFALFFVCAFAWFERYYKT